MYKHILMLILHGHILDPLILLVPKLNSYLTDY